MTFLTPSILNSQAYDFAALRQIWNGRLIQSGVLNKGDLALSAKGSQPPMGITVAAGEAWIKSTSVLWNGAYHVINDAPVDLLLSAADATNPRIDRIILRMNDTTDLASLTDEATLEALPGTPTGGATLTNLNGAQTEPANSLTLGFVLVGAGVTSVAGAQIGCLSDPYGTANGFASAAGAASGAPPPYCLGRPAGHVPAVSAYNSAAQALAVSGTAYALAMNAERQDNDSGHDNVTNNSRLLITAPGLYQVIGNAEFAANATGVRTAELLLQGSVVLATDRRGASATGTSGISLSKLYRFVWGHYVELRLTQTSGGSLNTVANQCGLDLLWVGP